MDPELYWSEGGRVLQICGFSIEVISVCDKNNKICRSCLMKEVKAISLKPKRKRTRMKALRHWFFSLPQSPENTIGYYLLSCLVFSLEYGMPAVVALQCGIYRPPWRAQFLLSIFPLDIKKALIFFLSGILTFQIFIFHRLEDIAHCRW